MTIEKQHNGSLLISNILKKFTMAILKKRQLPILKYTD